MQHENYSIARATERELPVVRSLAYEIWPDTYNEILSNQQMEFMLGKMYSIDALTDEFLKGVIFLILNVNEVPSGFAAYGKIDATVFKLYKIYLKTSLQGLGLGKILLNYVLDDVAKQNATALQLQVNRQNPALNFYTKIGFRILYQADFDIGNGYFMNDYVMEKSIGS